MRRRLAFALLLAFGPITVGCERMRDVKRCRLLARQVNASFDVVESEVAKGDTRASYARVAAEYDALAKSLTGWKGGTPELERAVLELSSLIRTASRQATALDQAMKSNGKASAQLAHHELEKLARHEKTIAVRIDEECRPK